mmetsp:Transcript_30855/g.51055  ORF Transcript_30855/g.51055 Transcript_30855/m.51055 type:complete len:385 (-) Transcript_30855:294-1448(-)
MLGETIAVLVLAWHPQPNRGLHLMEQRVSHPPVVMQAGNSAAVKALEMLGKMGMQAATEAKPGVVPETKKFVASATIKHNRVIEAMDGGAVVDYLRLPVDQYAIYDSRLMRKLPSEEAGGDGDTFELSVPTMRPREGTFVPKPKIRVQVVPKSDQVALRSVGASFFGETNSALPPNLTAAQLQAANQQLTKSFDLAVNTTLAWSEARRRGPGATVLKCRTDVRLKIQLPAPFTRAPRPLVQGAIGLVMWSVGNAILPRFASLLEGDYQRWCNGTRELTRGLGSLTLDDDGYIVMPEAVLQKMRSMPDGRERLAAASATLDLDCSPRSEGARSDTADGGTGEGGAKADGEPQEANIVANASPPRGFGTVGQQQSPRQTKAKRRRK